MFITARNRHHASQPTDLNGSSHSFVSGGVEVAIAQLAILAAAPSPDSSVGLERQAGVTTAPNRPDLTQLADLNWCSNEVKVAITQLAILAAAPRQDSAVRLEPQATIRAGRNRHDAARTRDLNR